MRTAMVVLIVFGLGWSGDYVNAQDASRRALAEELLNAMNMKGASENTFDVIKKIMPSQMKAMEKGKKSSAEVTATTDAMQTKMEKATTRMMDEMAQEMSWEKVKDDYITIYAETYTEEELRGLIAFYKSPVGQAFTKKQPELMRRSMQLAQKRMLQWMPKIQAMTREAMEASAPSEKENKGKTSEPTPVVPAVVSAQEPKLRHTFSHDQQASSFPGEKPVMPSEVLSVAFSPDSRTLATVGSNGRIMLWDVATGARTAAFCKHGAVNSLAFSPDGKTLAAGSLGGSFWLWDVASGDTNTELKGHTDSVRSVAYSLDGKTLASGSWDKTVKLWDVATGKNTATLIGHAMGVDAVAFSPDCKTLASGSDDETVKLWDVATGKNTATLNGDTGPVASVAFSPDGKTLASAGSFGKKIRLWDITTGNNTATLEQDAGSLESLAFSPNGKTLASGSGDKVSGVIWLWDVATRKAVAVLKGHTNQVHAVAFSPDGKILASGSFDGTVKLWDVNTAKGAGVTSQQKPR